MFHFARIKLTAWYLLIIMLVSITFSAVIYKVLSYEVERFERTQRFRIERRLHITFSPANPELIEETKQRIFFMLSVVNLGIAAISGGLGYFLAGKTLEPIREMVDKQNRFISDASHELRTPLTSLKSSFEVYIRNLRHTTSEAKILITESIQEVDKLQSLSESLLQLAQYEDPQRRLSSETFSINRAVHEAMRKVKSIAHQKEISLVFDETDIEIEGNFYSFVELIIILLDNAIKYSEPGKTVRISVKKTDSVVSLAVTDQGIGIRSHDLPRIFERFYRADEARAKIASAGYGLGLSIAKKIAAIHKGTIIAQSTAGKGSIFTVRLPVKQFFSSFSD